MPKERRDRSVSVERGRTHPYPSSSSRAGQCSAKVYPETEENIKEWEESRCPVCMEHPHNSVLLICSSHEKGCRPYMCDTSYRHSNCLDQFCKSFTETSSAALHQENHISATQSLPAVAAEGSSGLQQGRNEDTAVQTTSCDNKVQQKLVCPLCRGHIKDWIVVEPARRFMNAKLRSCSCETCDFSGCYSDLRKHARTEHPLARPSETDPERQHNWRRLERQRDLGDLLSTLQSFGEERGEESVLPFDEGGWLSIYFLIRVFRPRASSRSSSWSSRTSRARGQHGARRRSSRLWGETHDGEAGPSSREEDTGSSDGGSDTWRRRVRRRMSPDNQP